MALVVHKYGGTSVADAERMRSVADYIGRQRKRGDDVVVAISAMGKMTDELERLATDVSETYRYATTAPYYVEIGGQPYISRSSAQFFLDWVNERMQNIHVDDAQQKQAILRWHEEARQYWQQKVDSATVK